MKNTFSHLFKQAIKAGEKAGSELQQACDEQKIVKLKSQAATILTMQIPEEYIDFLNQMDGYSDFGLMLYASHPVYLEKSDSWIYGLVETNHHYFQFFPIMLVLGECGDELLVYDDKLGLYKNIDRVGGNINAEFESFWEMIDDVLKNLIFNE